MKTQADIEKIVSSGKIENELDLERALIADRKLRLLAKKDPSYTTIRKKLRDIIEKYENTVWSVNKIDAQKIKESEQAEDIAEKERVFVSQRKQLIKQRLKELNLTQQQLGFILGHRSKTYISELINGISPIALKDLIIINRLLKIELSDLLPTFLTKDDQIKVKSAISELNNPKLKLSNEDFKLK